MEKYHKIQTMFKRDPSTNHKTLLENDWSIPEFEYLMYADWEWTEKVDGTNIRILWDGATLNFKGKTDNAQLPATLVNVLREIFTEEKLGDVFPNPGNICLYGEGYGFNIQKAGKHYNPDTPDFILFDVWIDGIWLLRENVNDIAAHLGIESVPIIGIGDLWDAYEFCKKGYVSNIASEPDFLAEGLVLRPKMELRTRSGSRIITKIKYKDFDHG